jgi:uncharacterized membrane protein
MVKTIGNPGTWLIQGLFGAAERATESVEHIGGSGEIAPPKVQHLEFHDIRDSLRKGYDDFAAARADVMFICLLYPVIGVLLAGVAFNSSLLPLLFPVAAGFAILGPVAAIMLYEISRRREKGETVRWTQGLSLLGAPNIGAIIVLALYLVAIFFVWVMVAGLIYDFTLGPEPPVSASAFLRDIVSTGAGRVMLVAGMGTGFLFALAALAISVVSFPLLLDRDVGVPVAVTTSIEVTRRNPRIVLLWGLIVATGLFLGSLPFFAGLIVVLPVLGHSTWHLYRRAVA